MGTTPLTIDLAGCRATLTSADADFNTYAAAHLATLRTVQPLPPASQAVSARLRWHVGLPPRARASHLARLQRVDRDIYVDGAQLHWFRVDDLRDLHMRVTWKDRHLEVVGDFYYRLGNSALSDRLRRAISWRRSLRMRRYTTLLYYLLYYPCWWWIEQTRALHPIHAAGVLTDKGVILLAGASGIGKSSLAIALASLGAGRLLSDSFVLHNGTDVVAVREPVLIDAAARRWIGHSATTLERIDWRYSLKRDGYHLSAERWADAGQAALLVFPRHAPDMYVRRLSSEEARCRLSAADLVINDLRRYWAFAAVLEQLEPTGLVAQREAQIAQLTAAVPCYEFGLAPETTATAAVEALSGLLRGKQLRAIG